jgi:hypothetical protein
MLMLSGLVEDYGVLQPEVYMRRSTKLLCAGAMVWLVAAACQAPPPAAPPAPAAPPPMAPAERGKYIVSTAGCHDCHTPWKLGANGLPENDMTRALSGHPAGAKLPPPPKLTDAWNFTASATFTAFYGPWGISYAANLTPDPNTGTGIWTEKQFVDAIRNGKHMGEASSRDILPPMPWPVYRNLTDDDLKAVYAYLRTVPPIANRVPDPVPPPDVAKMK